MANRDYTGQRFGQLTALSPHHTNGRRWFWIAQCDCGTEKIVRADKLTSGQIVSCGCNQHAPWTGGAGHPSYVTWTDWVGTRTYRSWAQMLCRCENPKHDKYEYYGGNGITVCERWHSFGNFLADMGERPPGKSIDRWPDPYGNYEPGNCRWATRLEQRRNWRKPGTAKSIFPK